MKPLAFPERLHRIAPIDLAKLGDGDIWPGPLPERSPLWAMEACASEILGTGSGSRLRGFRSDLGMGPQVNESGYPNWHVRTLPRAAVHGQSEPETNLGEAEPVVPGARILGRWSEIERLPA